MIMEIIGLILLYIIACGVSQIEDRLTEHNILIKKQNYLLEKQNDLIDLYIVKEGK